ncbi:hypothetical protein [Fischerella thermalis]|nr:hypothetical protein [Fischerella thermalis]
MWQFKYVAEYAKDLLQLLQDYILLYPKCLVDDLSDRMNPR